MPFRHVVAGVTAQWVGKASRLATKQLASNLEVSPLPQSSIAPIRQPRLLPPTADEAWPEDVWDVLPADVQRDVLHVLARLLIRWFAQMEPRP
jgi:hypothetical protein